VRNTWNFAFSITMKVGNVHLAVGTGWLKSIVRIENGQGREEDIDLL
jgi:hypothetical protein